MQTRQTNHSTISKIIIALLFLLFLTACAAQHPSQSTNPTSTPIVITNAASPTPTPLWNVTQTAAARSTLFAATPMPSATPMSDIPPLPSPSVKGAEDYTLVTPLPEDLFKTMELAGQVHSYAIQNGAYDDQSDPELHAMSLDTVTAIDFLDEELGLYYPDGLTNKSSIWEYYPIHSGDLAFQYPNYLGMLTDALYEEVSQGKVSINPPAGKNGYYSFEIYPVEIDYDPQPELLMLVNWFQAGADTWIALDQNEDGSYSRLKSELPLVKILQLAPSIELIQDITGDQLTDIIFLVPSYLMGTDMGKFYVAQGTPQGFKLIGEIDQVIPGYLSSGLQYEIKADSNDNYGTLTLTNPNDINWDCNWNTVETYAWPNGKQQITVEGKEPPQTPDCYLAQAVSVSNPLDRETAIQLLEKAVAVFPEDSSKASFAHYRLSVLYALDGSELKARKHFQWFVDHYQQSEKYREETLVPLLDEPVLNPLKVCDLFLGMSSKAGETIPEGWLPYINATSALNAYPALSEVYPPAICPINRFLKEQLGTIPWEPGKPISAKLEKAGISVLAENEYSFDPLQKPARFILVGEKSYFLIGYIPDEDGIFQAQISMRFGYADQQPEVFFEDVTRDGYPELVYDAPLNDTPWCNLNETGHTIFVITSTNRGFTGIADEFCWDRSKKFDMRDYLADKDQDGKVDWVMERVNEDLEEDPLSTPRFAPLSWFSPGELQSELYRIAYGQPTGDDDPVQQAYQSQSPAQARLVLLKQRDEFTGDTPLALHTWQKLTYLIAITYEREGMTQEAIETYISLLHSKPQSIWWSLALNHLKVKLPGA